MFTAVNILLPDHSFLRVHSCELSPYAIRRNLTEMAGDPAPMTDQEIAAHAALLAEYRTLEEECSGQEEYPEEIEARLGE